MWVSPRRMGVHGKLSHKSQDKGDASANGIPTFIYYLVNTLGQRHQDEIVINEYLSGTSTQAQNNLHRQADYYVTLYELLTYIKFLLRTSFAG